MKVSSIMTTSPVTVSPGTDLDGAMNLMDEHSVRHLPVVEDGRLLGVVSDRDILEATGWLPARIRDVYRGPTEARSGRVRDVMLATPMTVSPDDSLVAVLVESVKQRRGCLPVVVGDRLAGIVTEMDILEAFVSFCERETRERALETTVDDLMSRGAVSLSPSATLLGARDMLERLGTRHLPIVEHGRVVGIVSDRDLRRAHGRGRGDDHPLADLMSPDVVRVAPGTSLHQATMLMLKGHFSCLPVVEDDELVGILTLTDVLDHCAHRLRDQESTAT